MSQECTYCKHTVELSELSELSALYSCTTCKEKRKHAIKYKEKYNAWTSKYLKEKREIEKLIVYVYNYS